MNALKQENIFEYKGEFTLMGTKEKSKTNKGNGSNGNKTRDFFETIKEFWVVIAAVFAAIFFVSTSLAEHGKDIEALNEKYNDMKTSYESIDTTVKDLKELIEDDHEVFLELAAISKEQPAYIVEFKDIYQVKMESIQSEEYLAAPLWEQKTIIASDINGDIVYKAEDLINTPIITSYLENGNEVYFYGKFNENNNWNGKCILNVYNGNNLLSIFEGIYDDGTLFSYKRVFGGNDNTWTISDRTNQGEYNSGETWVYTKTDEFVKDFTIENVKEKQIISVDGFLASREEKLLSYYNGNTSNGLYNDDTGMAYLVKYKIDGDVDILYNGRFKDGNFQDKTGNAWFISWGNKNDGYYYYQGSFNGGKHGKAPTPWEPMTQEQIVETVSSGDYKCPLTGLLDEVF